MYVCSILLLHCAHLNSNNVNEINKYILTWLQPEPRGNAPARLNIQLSVF